MRQNLVSWLLQVRIHLKMHLRTSFLAVKLLDIYLSHRKIEKSELQMLGTAALWIANKFEDVHQPELSNFIYVAAGSANIKGMVTFENSIMQLISFNLMIPTVIDFFSIYCF